jgi:hypothetical protein
MPLRGPLTGMRITTRSVPAPAGSLHRRPIGILDDANRRHEALHVDTNDFAPNQALDALQQSHFLGIDQ